MNERWLPVVGYEGLYEVSDAGRVRSLDRVIESANQWKPFKKLMPGRILKTPISSNGYQRVTLCRGSKRLDAHVHKLVLESFVGTRPNGMEACHNDGDKSNNKLENLRWDTTSANHYDKAFHGTMRRGSNHPKAKLKESEIPIIREMGDNGFLKKEIADTFGVSSATIGSILRGRTWTHIERVGVDR